MSAPESLTARPALQRIQILYALLMASRKFNATTLAKALETSTKTVHRDIEFMRDRMGVNIQYDGTTHSYTMQAKNCCPFCTNIGVLLASITLQNDPDGVNEDKVVLNRTRTKVIEALEESD